MSKKTSRARKTQLTALSELMGEPVELEEEEMITVETEDVDISNKKAKKAKSSKEDETTDAKKRKHEDVEVKDKKAKKAKSGKEDETTDAKKRKHEDVEVKDKKAKKSKNDDADEAENNEEDEKKKKAENEKALLFLRENAHENWIPLMNDIGDGKWITQLFTSIDKNLLHLQVRKVGTDTYIDVKRWADGQKKKSFGVCKFTPPYFVDLSIVAGNCSYNPENKYSNTFDKARVVIVLTDHMTPDLEEDLDKDVNREEFEKKLEKYKEEMEKYKEEMKKYEIDHPKPTEPSDEQLLHVKNPDKVLKNYKLEAEKYELNPLKPKQPVKPLLPHEQWKNAVVGSLEHLYDCQERLIDLMYDCAAFKKKKDDAIASATQFTDAQISTNAFLKNMKKGSDAYIKMIDDTARNTFKSGAYRFVEKKEDGTYELKTRRRLFKKMDPKKIKEWEKLIETQKAKGQNFDNLSEEYKPLLDFLERQPLQVADTDFKMRPNPENFKHPLMTKGAYAMVKINVTVFTQDKTYGVSAQLSRWDNQPEVILYREGDPNISQITSLPQFKGAQPIENDYATKEPVTTDALLAKFKWMNDQTKQIEG